MISRDRNAPRVSEVWGIHYHKADQLMAHEFRGESHPVYQLGSGERRLLE